jgi:hypothetical protein
MKNLFKGSVALLLFALSITIFQMSCKNNTIAVPTSGLTKEQILVILSADQRSLTLNVSFAVPATYI